MSAWLSNLATVALLWTSGTPPAPPEAPPPPTWIVAVRSQAGALFGSRLYGDVLLVLLLSTASFLLLAFVLLDITALGMRCCRVGLASALFAASAITLSIIITMSATEFGADYAALGDTLMALWRFVTQWK